VVFRGLVGVAVHLRQQRPHIGQQVVGGRPSGFAVVECGDQPRAGGQATYQHLQASRRQFTAVEIDQVYSVVALKVGLYLVAVLVEPA
jgi:hypothetical protein